MVVNYAGSCQDERNMDDISVRFARRLKQLRKRSGISQERLAELAEISEKHVQRLESHEPCGIRLVTLERIAKAFGVSLSELLKF